jgi:cysteinyl-tRNA synthetase
MQEAIEIERKFENFFENIKLFLRRNPEDVNGYYKPFTEVEKNLLQRFGDNRKAVDTALRENINTQKAIFILNKQIEDTQNYLETQKTPNRAVLKTISDFITKILQVFGVIPKNEFIRFPTKTSSETSEEQLLPYLEDFAQFREEIRKSSKKFNHDLFDLCDKVRDDVFPKLGYRLEDKGEGKFLIQKESATVLLKERHFKRAEEEKKRQEKERKKAETTAKQVKKAALQATHPGDLFRDQFNQSRKQNFHKKGNIMMDVVSYILKKMRFLFRLFKQRLI